MINVRFMLLVSFVFIIATYSTLLPFAKIVNIVLDEYIAISITFILYFVYLYFKAKMKTKLLYEFIPNLNYVPLQSTIMFFVLFQGYDYYSEGGFIPMISLWFMYWIFGLCAHFGMNAFNLYKNMKAYKVAESNSN